MIRGDREGEQRDRSTALFGFWEGRTLRVGDPSLRRHKSTSSKTSRRERPNKSLWSWPHTVLCPLKSPMTTTGSGMEDRRSNKSGISEELG